MGKGKAKVKQPQKGGPKESLFAPVPSKKKGKNEGRKK